MVVHNPMFCYNGQKLTCTRGSAPGLLTTNGPAPATAFDFVPLTNIQPFGMCGSAQNPQVAAATAAAAGGALIPMGCVPMTISPWQGVSITSTAGTPPAGVVTKTSRLVCAWGGEIIPNG
jgi:hypothetical protein